MSFTFFSMDAVRSSAIASERRQCLETLLSEPELLAATLEGLRPEFMRLRPPLMPVYQAAAVHTSKGTDEDDTQPDSEWAPDELIWLCPLGTVDHQFHWDATMGKPSPTNEASSL